MIGSYSSGSYAMQVFDSRTAEEKANDAMNARRKEWYGTGWYLLDLWGRPLQEKKTPEPSNYEGKRFVDGMARKISKGVKL